MNLRRLAKRAATVVALLVLVVVVGAFAVYAVPDLVGADQSFVVLSSSMTPAMAPGDAVIVADADPTTIREGDVITFARSGEPALTTHRVVDVTERNGRPAFETKGDAVPDSDPELVPAENVLGRVTLTIPYIGHVILFADTTPGFALLVGLPVFLLVATEVWSLARRYRRNSAADATTTDGDAEADRDATADGDPVSDDGVDEPAAGAAASSPAAADDAAAGSGTGATLALHPSDLTLTTLALALVAPYAVYVAVSLPTPLTLTVAFASGFSLFAVGGLWLVERLSARGHSAGGGATADDSPPDSVTDGGTPEEVE